MTSARRSRLASVLSALAALVLGLAVVADHARTTLFDADSFAGHAAAILRDDHVRALVAERVTDQVVLPRDGDLLAARPLIEGVVAGVIGSPPFRSVFQAGVRDVHRAVFDRDQNTVTLTLADVGTVAAQAVRAVRPKLAARIDGRDVELLRRHVGSVTASLARTADRVKALALILLLAGLALAAAALAVAPDRRRAVFRLAVGGIVAGTAIAVVCIVARPIVLGTVADGDPRAAAGAVWDELAGGLVRKGWLLALAGAVIAAAAASVLRPVGLGAVLRERAPALVREPARPALRVLRGVALVVTGLLVAFHPSAVLRAVAVLAGVALVYAGVDALLRLIYRPADPEAARAPSRPRRPGRRAGALAVAALLIAGVVALFAGTRDETIAAPPPTGACNGHRALCSRTLPEVALMATHNSMAVPLPGWYAAEQDHPIARQLAQGVRGLLIDTYYGDRLSSGRVRTVFDGPIKLGPDAVSPKAQAAALRLRGRLGFRGKGTRGMYLCHSFCELGFTSLGPVLADVRDFLVAHPGEIVVFVNQDSVRPADFVGAMRRAGLDRLALTPPADGRWPTLGQMVKDDRRLVVMAENHAGEAPWYRLAYRGELQETPFMFKRASLLTAARDRAASCRPLRGGTNAPLLLLNHWVSTDPVPRPSDAATVNARGPLLARARECERIRHQLPNLVAVNFYRRGDVLGVVDALNGVGR